MIRYTHAETESDKKAETGKGRDRETERQRDRETETEIRRQSVPVCPSMFVCDCAFTINATGIQGRDEAGRARQILL